MTGLRACATSCSGARAKPSSRPSPNTPTNSKNRSSDERSREEPRTELMRASVLRDDVPEPAPGPGQVLVEVKACGICGSDLHFAKHGRNVLKLSDEMSGLSLGDVKVNLSEDVFMGHEFSAEILEAGPDTEAPTPGAVVTSIPVLLSAAGLEPIVYSNTLV